MKARALILMLLAAAAPASAQRVCGGPVPNAVVSAAWIRAHGGQFLLLRAGRGGGGLSYAQLTAPALGLGAEMPAGNRFSRLLAQAGVSPSSRIVLYRAPGTSFVQLARAWATFDVFGLGGSVSLGSGGAGLAPPRSPVRTARLRRCPGALATLGYVVGHAGRPGTVLVDARLPRYYSGAVVEVPGELAGHIPHAVNLPFRRLLNAGRLRSLPALRHQFQQAGIMPSEQIIVYCHSGQKAAVVYLAARMLGFRVRLFDGSWQAWSRDRRLPVVHSPRAGGCCTEASPMIQPPGALSHAARAFAALAATPQP